MAGIYKETGSGLVSGYDKRNFDAGPATYNDAGFMRKIVDATGLADFSGSAVVVDAMSGPGKVG